LVIDFLTEDSAMDFIHNIHLDQLVDIGFGLLVAGICIKTLFHRPECPEKAKRTLEAGVR
jgi:hypothetical protein